MGNETNKTTQFIKQFIEGQMGLQYITGWSGRSLKLHIQLELNYLPEVQRAGFFFTSVVLSIFLKNPRKTLSSYIFSSFRR